MQFYQPATTYCQKAKVNMLCLQVTCTFTEIKKYILMHICLTADTHSNATGYKSRCYAISIHGYATPRYNNTNYISQK